MAEQFYTILTETGKALLANATALGNKVNFTNFAFGDSDGKYYNPTGYEETLKKEVYRGKISQIKVDENNPNWIILESVIPGNIGGFAIREAGVFDEDNNLIAIGKYPETYKPKVENGSSKDLYVRMILEISNADVVNLKIDPSVILATKKDLEEIKSDLNKQLEESRSLEYSETNIDINKRKKNSFYLIKSGESVVVENKNIKVSPKMSIKLEDE